ncbi:isochorismatase family protein [Methylotuvimicrobium alcaliphilum]|uniref:nicotinamidase n=1 Tax=Methylotuvimicrobium alcaliphilum (strain DSM 19304 / NCIMB 14124 / VKM B-2133 / 20Z) TaxID=1091494 RepID=G4SXK7_META2|nr:isochorismatase family protein [Methylotuvimicrobium alcaliphilum]CCE22062.1 Nicotinamidase [Methylotuvimicrobium alcaliphilum 20Z]
MHQADSSPIRLKQGDALIVVDVQKDFLPGGALAVAGGDKIIPVVNAYIERFIRSHLPVFATRDWHPSHHCSFAAQSGPWPVHCVAGSKGAEFAPSLLLPDTVVLVSTGDTAEAEGYSAFENPKLESRLNNASIQRLFVCGIATDYCVLQTVRDALRLDYQVFLLHDALAAVNIHPQDGLEAERIMADEGARLITLDDLS